MALGAGQALALVRMGFGLYFLDHAWDKTAKGWLSDGGLMTQFIERALPNSDAFYAPFLEGVVLPNATLFAQLVVIGEWVAGLSLVLGLLTRLGAITGAWLVLNYMFMKGTLNTSGSNDRLFFVTCIAFAAASAGLVWGLDGALRGVLRTNPVTRWLAGLPAGVRVGAIEKPTRLRRKRAA